MKEQRAKSKEQRAKSKEQRAKSCSIKALPLFKEGRCETIAPTLAGREFAGTALDEMLTALSSR
ncbi:MAG: hypothetical protein IKU76_06580 [Bacteroidaceae bacterium]|nr:hypothetical protein [Bacteroidaceae bacterium]